MLDDPRTAEQVRGVAAELANGHPGDRSIRTALLERAVDAVERLTHTVDDQQLREAINAGTDTAFLEALSRLATTALADSTTTDPLAAATKRGEQAKREILAEQGQQPPAEARGLQVGASTP